MLDVNTEYRNFVEKVARSAQRAFIDVRRNIIDNKLTGNQKAAIESLPHDNITKEPINRLRKFPNDCCMDSGYVLAIIFTAMAQQNGFEFAELMHIRCRPTEKTKTVMFDFHQWLRIDGYDVDITFDQCRTVLKGNRGKIIFEPHPLLENDDSYEFETANAAEIAEPFAGFANFVITEYLHRTKN
jgi:hypothetical protein